MTDGAPAPLSRNAALAAGVALVAAALVLVPMVWTDFAAIEGLVYLPAAMLVVAACAGAGLALLRALRIDCGEDAAWIAAAIGAGVVGHVQLALAHMGLFGRASSFVVVALGLVLLAMCARPLRDATWPFPTTRDGAAWTAACAPFVVAALVLCAAPPSFYDALVYHVGLIEQLIVRGEAGLSAVVTQHDMFTAMPFASELAAGTAFAIDTSPEAMGLVHALWFAILVVGTASVARDAFGASSAGPAAFVVASMPLPLFLAAADKPDVLHALLFLVAIRCVVRAVARTERIERIERRDRLEAIDARLLFLALGLACATKLSALPMGAAVVAAVLVLPTTRRALFAAGPRAIGVGVILGAAFASPPYLRNLIALGNPVYPFASSIFGGPSWLAQTSTLLNGDAIRAHSIADVGALVVKPFFGSDAFANEAVGPLALFALLAPLAFVGGATRERRVSVVLLTLIAATLVPWLLTHALPRYAPVLWLGVALLAGAAIAALTATPVVRWLAVVVIAVLAAVNASWSLRANEVLLRGPSRNLVGAEERGDTITRVLDLAPAYRAAASAPHLDGTASSSKRCVFLATGEPRIAYLHVPAVLGESYTQPPLVAVLEGATGVDDVVARIRATGATHVLVDDRAPSLYARRGWAVNTALLGELLRTLPATWNDGSGHVLLEVPAPVWRNCSL